MNEKWFLDQQRLMQRAIDLQSIFRWHFVLYFNQFLLMQRAVDLQNVDVWNIDLFPVDLQICTPFYCLFYARCIVVSAYILAQEYISFILLYISLSQLYISVFPPLSISISLTISNSLCIAAKKNYSKREKSNKHFTSFCIWSKIACSLCFTWRKQKYIEFKTIKINLQQNIHRQGPKPIRERICHLAWLP